MILCNTLLAYVVHLKKHDQTRQILSFIFYLVDYNASLIEVKHSKANGSLKGEGLSVNGILAENLITV